MIFKNKKISLKTIIYASMVFISLVYSFIMVPNVYSSTAKFSIESGTEKTTFMPTWLPSTSNNKDAHLLKEYAKSTTMLGNIKKKFSISDEYFLRALSPYSRIFSSSGSYGVAESYREFLKYIVDETSGVITVSYETTDPRMSKKILDYVIDESNIFINKISSDRLEKESQRQEVIVAKYFTEMNKLKQQLARVKKEMGVISPAMEMESGNSKISQLEKVKLEKELELAEKKVYLANGSPTITALELEIKRIAQLIENSKKEMVSGDLEKSSSIKKYEELVSRVEIAKTMWQKTLSDVSITRESIKSGQKTFVLIQAPALVSDPVGPNRFYNFLTIMMTLMMFYFVGRFVLETILDHRD